MTALAAPTRPEQIDLLMAVAIHEAGHIIIASTCGLRTRNARVRRTWGGGGAGAVEISDDSVDRPREYALMLIGGVQAAAMWLHRVHGHEPSFARTWGDDSGCRDLARFREFSRVARVPLSIARKEVDAILSRNFGRLERGALLLHHRRRMPASKI